MTTPLASIACGIAAGALLGVVPAMGGPLDGMVLSATRIVDHGPDGPDGCVRFTFVLMSEGYKASEMNKFHQDAQHFVDNFLQTPPFNTNCGIFNFWRIDVSSTDSGADNPATCLDDDPAMPETAVTAKTYFDATFCGVDGKVRRRLTVDSSTPSTVLNAHVPAWDAALIIVNTNKFGGSGGPVAVTSNTGENGLDWTQVAIHEFGHSAFGLADEYCTGNPIGFPTLYNTYPGGEPMEPNVTVETNPDLVKWRDLFTPGIPIPTTMNTECEKCPAEPVPAPGQVGLYVGAKDYHCGIYRPAVNCMMRDFSAFCPVCIRRILEVLAPYAPANGAPICEVEPNNTPGTAMALDVRTGFAAVFGSIVPANDVDFYSVAAPAGSKIWIHVDTGGPLVDPDYGQDSLLTLLAPDGVSIIEIDDDDGYGSGWDTTRETVLSSAIAGRTLPVSGTYFVKVRGYSDSKIIHEYRLSIVVTACSPKSEAGGNQSLGAATPIVTRTIPVGVRLAEISAPFQQDYYSVELPAFSCIQVSVDADPERDGTSTDVVVELLDQNGSPVLNPTPGSAGIGSVQNPRAVSFFLSINPAAPQKHYVRVKHSSSGTGTYCLMVRRDPAEVEPNPWFSPPTLDSLYQLPNGSTFAMASGSISTNGDSDSYKLHTPAPGGGRVWLLVDTGTAVGTSRDSILTLTHDEFDVTPLEMDDDDGIGNGGDGSIETKQASAIAGLDVSADYSRLVGVWSKSADLPIDAYTLYAVITTDAPTPEAEGNGTPDLANPLLDTATLIAVRSGTIGSAGDVDYYSVEAAEGEVLFISLDCNPAHDGSGKDLVLELIAPDTLTSLVTADSSGAGTAGNPPAESFCYKAPVSGAFFVKVRHGANGTGPYLLMAARNNAALQLLPEKIAGSNVELSFSTMPERKYQVQFTESLTEPPAWTTLPGTVTGTGLSAAYIHANGALAPKRFYRVIQVP